MSTADGRGVVVAGVLGAAVLAALLLVPGLRIGASQPWLGAVVILVPTAVMLAVTGFWHYGLGRAVTVALGVAMLAGGVSWFVAVFVLVKALSGVGIGLAWAVLLFLTSAVAGLLGPIE